MVRDHDRIILESCRFKGLQLSLEGGTLQHQQHGSLMTGTSFTQELDSAEDGIVSVSDDAYMRSGTTVIKTIWKA